ncbi:MAG: ABC transporter permease [Chlorobium phaeobacteroides]|uniref:ABC3 transporter permease protein domain-containing protein n=1 Tax=Chlorobium phaeobacteroides (strain BS1) TaxID=331678 RepID=B3EMU0_CHLPB|nr:ABC transporter permease [Chlorobium phaeobacteroides]
MTYLDHLTIAWVHLRERKRQTILTALGVAVGSAMLVTTIAIAGGMSRNVVNKIIDIAPHIIVSAERIEPLVPDNLLGSTGNFLGFVEKNITVAEKKTIKNYPDTVERIGSVGEVEIVSPFVTSNLIVRNRSRFTSCTAKGVLPEKEAGIANLGKKLVESNALAELAYTPDGILVGNLLAEDLKASYHSRLLLISKNGLEFPVTVVGRFSTGFNAKDRQEAYINLALAQRIEGIAANAVTSIGLRTADVGRAGEVAEKVEQLTGFQSESWDESNKNVIEFYNRNGTITLVLVGFVFIVAGLGVSSVMTTVVLQKIKDIAIMRSMGVKQSSITAIFMTEGFIIGLLGVVFGCPIGHFITRLVGTIRFEANTAGVLQSDRINISETPESYIIVIVFGILISVISSIGPARKAAGYVPVKILRGQM